MQAHKCWAELEERQMLAFVAQHRERGCGAVCAKEMSGVLDANEIRFMDQTLNGMPKRGVSTDDSNGAASGASSSSGGGAKLIPGGKGVDIGEPAKSVGVSARSLQYHFTSKCRNH